jgi:transposase
MPMKVPTSDEVKWVEVDTDEVKVENAREAGPVHAGHQMWRKLGIGEVLREAGLDEREEELAEVLALNRLIEPSSEYATPEWVDRTALSDILGEQVSSLNYRELYKELDTLHPQREQIERALAARETNLFNLDTSVYMYDLTSTYFEGNCGQNDIAKHGYSRDSRPDCRQVVIGLILNRDGFPIGHEIFEGNRVDCKTVEAMLSALDHRTGGQKGLTITVDRGMSDNKNLELIKTAGHHYIVAAKQTERLKWLNEFEDKQGWVEVVSQPSPTRPNQHKTEVKVKRYQRDEETYILCVSEGRKEKDRAIREKQEKKLLKDLASLQKRISSGKLVGVKKICEAIGRLKERYPRVARYYQIDFDETSGLFIWSVDTEKKSSAEKVDGSYLLRTDRNDLSDEEIWQTYVLLTRVEAAFRDIKSPLAVRPIYHQLQRRTEAHIFVCVLAYHLLVAIEKLLHDAGINSSWETVRKQLSTHQVVSAHLPTKDGRILVVRRDTTPNEIQKQIYQALGITERVFASPRKTWLTPKT